MVPLQIIMAIGRILYKSYLFVAGLALMVLGAGNYFIAASRLEHYQEAIKNVTPAIKTDAFFLLSTGKPQFPSEARERWEIARAKRDFYHVVLSAGRFMVGIGLLCTAISLIRLRSQWPQMAMALHSSPPPERNRYAKISSSS
jgi:hypothetical protein